MLNLDLAVGGAQRSRQQGVGMPTVAHGEISDFAAKTRFCTPGDSFTYPCEPGGRGLGGILQDAGSYSVLLKTPSGLP